ncbi:MAG: hypothetical protein ABH950_00505 [Candidatus Altiarchaeota archaeon]
MKITFLPTCIAFLIYGIFNLVFLMFSISAWILNGSSTGETIRSLDYILMQLGPGIGSLIGLFIALGIIGLGSRYKQNSLYQGVFFLSVFSFPYTLTGFSFVNKFLGGFQIIEKLVNYFVPLTYLIACLLIAYGLHNAKKDRLFKATASLFILSALSYSIPLIIHTLLGGGTNLNFLLNMMLLQFLFAPILCLIPAYLFYKEYRLDQ